MILKCVDGKDNETAITVDSEVYVKDENYEAHIDWTKLTPATREVLSDIATQAEELRVKSVDVLRQEFPESCLELDLDQEQAVSE